MAQDDLWTSNRRFDYMTSEGRTKIDGDQSRPFARRRRRVDEIEICASTGHGISADLKQRQIEIGSMSEGSGLVIRTITKGNIRVKGEKGTDKSNVTKKPC